LITFFVRIPALAMRLCINMAVGHMLIEIFALLAAQLGPVVGLLHIPCLALECVTAVLQAYIFTMLSCIYLKDAVQFHH